MNKQILVKKNWRHSSANNLLLFLISHIAPSNAGFQFWMVFLWGCRLLLSVGHLSLLLDFLQLVEDLAADDAFGQIVLDE